MFEGVSLIIRFSDFFRQPSRLTWSFHSAFPHHDPQSYRVFQDYIHVWLHHSQFMELLSHVSVMHSVCILLHSESRICLICSVHIFSPFGIALASDDDVPGVSSRYELDTGPGLGWTSPLLMILSPE